MRNLYMTDWGEVVISPEEASLVQTWLEAQRFSVVDTLPKSWVNRALALMADIERVAKWKYENA